MRRVRMNDDDMTLLVDVIEDTEALDVSDVSDAIVQAMECAGYDRDEAHAIARFGLAKRPEFLALME